MQHGFFIGTGYDAVIPFTPIFRPLCRLRFAGDSTFESDLRIFFFELQHGLGCKDIHTHCHSGDKVRNAVLGDLLFYGIR